MFCPECGYENNEGNKFCMGCGKDLKQLQQDVPNETFEPINSGDFSDTMVLKKEPLKNNKRILYIAIPAAIAVIAAVLFVLVYIGLGAGTARNKSNDRIAASASRMVVLNDDGTVTPYLMNSVMENEFSLGVVAGFGQCDASDWKDITAVVASSDNTIGLKKDGTVVATGDGWLSDEVSKWKDISVIASSERGDAAGIKKDGTVITTNEELNVSGWKDIVDISMGDNSIVGLKKDGTIVYSVGGVDSVWEEYLKNLTKFVSEWKDIVDIEITNGVSYTFPNIIAVRKDGTIATAIFNDKENDWVSSDNYSDWKDITSISVGDGMVVGLKKDGTVISSGANVSDWKDIIAVSAGDNFIAGLKKDGTFVSTESMVEYDKAAVD